MKRMYLGEVAFIALALSVTALTSCGGGNPSSNPPPVFSNASLNGVYYGSSFNVNSLNKTSSLEKATFDGNGHVTVEQIFGNASGANQTQTVNATYSVNADGTYTITNGSEVAEGRLSTDSSTSVGATVNSTMVQNISAGAKAGVSGFSNASLNGIYYSSSFNVTSSGAISSIQKGTFDGIGSVDVEQIYSDGTASGINQTQTITGATYSVNTDGTYTLTYAGETSDGRISADGNTVVSARINSTLVQNVGFGVKGGGSGYSNASLNGVYYCTTLYLDNGKYVSSIEKLTFDGIGHVTYAMRYGSTTGANLTKELSGATYAVNADGSFTLSWNGITYTQGWLSANSKSFVAANVGTVGFQSISTGVKQ